jgi:hypothetical protein
MSDTKKLLWAFGDLKSHITQEDQPHLSLCGRHVKPAYTMRVIGHELEQKQPNDCGSCTKTAVVVLRVPVPWSKPWTPAQKSYRKTAKALRWKRIVSEIRKRKARNG